jgi:hypothetical protein
MQLRNLAGPILVRAMALFFVAMWEVRAVVVIPSRRYERHHRTLSLLSVGALASAEEEDSCAEEAYGGCDADGYADVGACCEGVVGG